ncbi:hypothetical protein [Lachnospira pectinoschiza]|uniref:Uncharacterized protein n=1 Tax=Lachnospira pectinoschiza TaxID=28052 RepID=A0A1G9UC16_9FIRM|nr:hypothetical protein [Lachnospira pectinoschiza]SDM57095.1 hypothetical protein SAMN05216544_0693 [Lachnospira pectinoschiza]
MGKKQESNDNTGKVVTKYDKKVAKRKEEERKAKRNKFIAKTVALCLVAIIVISGVAAFSLRYYRIHTQFIKVNNENVSEIEFDFYYGMTKSTLFNTTLYSDMTYLDYYENYLGYSSSKKDKAQTYSDDYTWYDYFASQTVDTIKEYKALLQLASEAGYEYTTADDDYNEFVENITSTAESNSMSVKEYVKSLYGDNASLSNIKSYILEVLEAQSYLEQLQEELAATDEEVAAYIAENYSSDSTESTDSTDSTESTEDSSTDYDEDEIRSTILSQKYNEVISPVMEAMSFTNIHNRIKMYSSSTSSTSSDSEDSDTSEESTEEAQESTSQAE